MIYKPISSQLVGYYCCYCGFKFTEVLKSVSSLKDIHVYNAHTIFSFF